MPSLPCDLAFDVIGLGKVTEMPACSHARAIVITAVGDGFELLDAEHGFRLAAHVGELRPVRAAIRHFVRDDQVVLSIDDRLHVIADHAGATAARRH